jgi:ubiquinone/menaquinone biosynthesis C-methylase UbiE
MMKMGIDVRPGKAQGEIPHQMTATGVASAEVHGTFDESTMPSLADGNFVDSLGRYYVIAPQVAGQRVLDLACGKGQGAAILRQRPAALVQYDLCLESLLFGRQYFPSLRAAAVNGNCLALPFADQSFNAVIAFEIIEHIEIALVSSFLSEISRVLRLGGRAFLSTPNHAVVLRAGTFVPPYHINNLKPRAFLRALRPHFRRVRLYGFLRRQGLVRDMLKLIDVFNLRHRLVKYIQPQTLEIAPTDPAQPWWDGREIPPALARYTLSRWYVRQAGCLIAVCEV